MLLCTACGRINYDQLAVDSTTPDASDDAPDASMVDASPGGAADALQGCPQNYQAIQGSCYLYESDPKSWLAAEADCENDAPGAHLAVVGSTPEHFIVHSLSTELEVWVGYTDRVTAGSFLWVAGDGIQPETNPCYWPSGEPSGGLGDNCVAQLAGNVCGDWFARNCDELKSYVCEYDDVSAVPSRY